MSVLRKQRAGRRLVFGILTATPVLGAQHAVAQSSPEAVTPAQAVLGMSVEQSAMQLHLRGRRHYQLAAIGLRDLSLNDSGRKASRAIGGEQRGVAVVSGRRVLTAAFDFPELPVPAVVTRRIEHLWRVTSRPDRPAVSPPVRVRWDNEQEAMTASDGGPGLAVKLQPIVQAHGFEQDTGRAYWEGGVSLKIQVEQLRGNVRYSGRLLIVMERL